MPTEIQDFLTKVALRASPLPGAYTLNKFGNAPALNSGDTSYIWDGGNQTDDFFTYNFQTTAQRLQLSSSSSADSVKVRVEGLGDGGTQQTATADLTGVSAAAVGTTATKWDRVNRMNVKGATDAVGNIYASVSGATLVDGVVSCATACMSKITAGNNQTLQAIFTVPLGYLGVLYNYAASVRSAASATVKTADVLLKARDSGGVLRTQHVFGLTTAGTSAYQHEFIPPVVFEPLTDVAMVAENIVNNSTQVAGSFGMAIVPKASVSGKQVNIPRLSA